MHAVGIGYLSDHLARIEIYNLHNRRVRNVELSIIGISRSVIPSTRSRQSNLSGHVICRSRYAR